MRASRDDVYKDIARIPEKYRKDEAGNVIPEGDVASVSVGQKKAYAIVRGLNDKDEPVICLDERKRNELGLQLYDNENFTLVRMGFIGQVCWAWTATEPAYRIAARLGIWSLILGILGLLLGIGSLR